MAGKNCKWLILAFCASMLTVAAPAVTQAADQPAEQGAKPKNKPEPVTCRYVDSPGSRVKRHVCGTAAQLAPDSRITTPMPSSSAASPSGVVPGMSEFSNPANQAAYRGFR
jgi:hypothetical protein